MRSLLPRGTLPLSAVLLGTVLLADTAEARRPVVAPGQQTPAKPPPPPPAPEAPATDGAAPAAPAVPAAAKPAGAAAEAAKPAEPPKPVDFVDAAAVAAPAVKDAPAELGPHRELRHTRVAGDFVYTLAVRPGEPKAGDPVELFFKINEILPIPDPAFGDRKPLEGGKLKVRVSGGGLDRTYEVHELADSGTYGAHFTAAAQGVYRLQVERTDGRRAQQLEFQLGVGVATPGVEKAATATAPRRDRNGVTEGVELVGVAGPDTSTIGGLMDELGRSWLELERHAGTPAAAAAAAQVREHAEAIAGKMPQMKGADVTEWEQLATALVTRASALGTGDRTTVLSAMQKTNDELCMRCHAKYRFQFADSVASWPDFSVKENLQPPAAPVQSSGRARTPFRAQ